MPVLMSEGSESALRKGGTPVGISIRNRPCVAGVGASLAFALAGCPSKPEVVQLVPTTIPLVTGAGVRIDAAGLRELATRLESSPDRIHAIVQLASAMTPRDFSKLDAAGVWLLCSFDASIFYAAAAPGADLGAQPLSDYLVGAGFVDPDDKIHPDLLADPLAPWVDAGNGLRRTRVLLFGDYFEGASTPQAWSERATGFFAGMGLQAESAGAGRSWSVVVDLDGLHRIAERDEVEVVFAAPPPERSLGELERNSVRSEQAQGFDDSDPAKVSYELSGEGVRIAICDHGIDEAHPAFAMESMASTACGGHGTSRFFHTRPEHDDHGTAVASVAAGGGVGSTGRDLRGHAPRACIGDYPRMTNSVELHDEVLAVGGADLSVHPHGISNGPLYTNIGHEIDLLVRGGSIAGYDIPARTKVWAAGNNGQCPPGVFSGFTGYYSLEVGAKNVLCVGSIDADTLVRSPFSSMGPTFDGRIKPDLMAPGAKFSPPEDCSTGEPDAQGVDVAHDGTDNYLWAAGTSYAAPAAAGCLALVMESYASSFVLAEPAHVLPATWRAILIETAEDLVLVDAPGANDNPDTGVPTLYFEGPDFATGFGRIRADLAADLVADWKRWLEGELGSSGQLHRYCMQVPSGSNQVSITLAWDDAPGCASLAETSNHLVNDLDLVLVDPNGVEHLPWSLDASPLGPPDIVTGIEVMDPDAQPQAVRGVDRRNNVEKVQVSSPVAGTWEVQVSAHHLSAGWSQPYGLAFSGSIAELCYIRVLPELFVEDLLREFPWLEFPGEMPPLWARSSASVTLPPAAILELEDVRRRLGLPMDPAAPAWLPREGFDLVLTPLDPDVQVLVFDANGAVLAHSTGGVSARRLSIEERWPGVPQYLALATSAGEPLSSDVTLDLRLEPPTRRTNEEGTPR